jgi:hypothetical protein
MGEVDGGGRGLQWRGAEDGVDVKGVGRGCGADKANNPLTKRAGGGCDRNVGGGCEFQTRGGAEATRGAGQDGAGSVAGECAEAGDLADGHGVSIALSLSLS